MVWPSNPLVQNPLCVAVSSYFQPLPFSKSHPGATFSSLSYLSMELSALTGAMQTPNVSLQVSVSASSAS